MMVYLLPGAGADERMFEKLLLPFETKVLKWMPWGDKSLPDYAKEMSTQIDVDVPFGIIGVSLGGMIALEISELLNPRFTILISSAKNRNELPAMVRVGALLGVNKFAFPWLLRSFPFAHYFMGFKRGSKHLFYKMLNATTDDQLQGSVKSIIKWNRKAHFSRVTHIHGENDKMIPINRLHDIIPLKGGGHFMIYTHASVIRELILEVIKKAS